MRAYPCFAAVLLAVACRPEFAEHDSLIDSPRVLAVKSEPAEAKPGTPLALTALVASPPDALEVPEPRWSFCTAPKPVTENNVVSSACLGNGFLVPVGAGLSVAGAAGSNACTLFGPDTPTGGYRPRDPDATGGYFQPLRVDLAGADPTFHLERVLCNLADASTALATQFGNTYVPNTNPHIASLLATSAGQRVGLNAIARGTRLTLDVGWSSADAETYAYFDRTAQAISMRREAMSVAWYASAGELATDSTGRAEDDPALDTTNTWTAPSAPGKARLWIVLRDSRGGVDFAEYEVAILP